MDRWRVPSAFPLSTLGAQSGIESAVGAVESAVGAVESTVGAIEHCGRRRERGGRL